jgi:hypothetical protein
MADVLCPICGRPNSDHREFCDFCGNPLDGALRVEDDASRLDSLVPAPEEEIQPANLEDRLDSDPLNGDSRLESLFAAQDNDFEEPSQIDPGFTEPLNGGSRLDDYLPIEKPTADLEPEDLGMDDSSRLDQYLSPEKPEEAPSLDFESLSSDQEDDSSRLDDYLTPETPPEKGEPEEAVRLDDLLADDPFKSPDPFLDPLTSTTEDGDPFKLDLDPFANPPTLESEPAQADDEPAEEPLFARDDFFTDSSSNELPEGSEIREPTPESEGPGDVSTPEPVDAEDWDFLQPTPEPEQPGEEITPESIDVGEWDFLDPSPTPEQPGEEKPPEPIDGGEWDFLDPSPTPEQPGEEKPPEPIDGGEWDFLDPPSTEGHRPSSESTESESPEDWSFLDPGPASDLPDDEGEHEYSREGEGEDAGWLDMLQDPGSRQSSQPEPEPTAELKKPQTDWLEKIRRLNKSSDLVDEDSSFPDWLSVTGKTAEFKGKDTADSPDSSDEVPDWLQLDDDDSLNEFLRKKDLTNEEYKPKVTTDSLDDADLPVDQDVPDLELSDSQQIKFPSWAEAEKKKGQQPGDVQPEDVSEEGPKEPEEPFQIEEEFFDDLFSEELPSWLTEASSDEVRRTIGEELAQGELPGWVEAMRPVVESTDASGLDDDEDYIENYGPLAGIPSVLPAEAEIGIDLDPAAQKPLDLLATKNHQEYVDLLKKLIGDENKSKSIILPSPLQTQRVLRWLIAIIMLVAIAGTLIFSGSVELDSPTAAQVQGTGFSVLYEEIETLYDGQPVLIAFDYQPAAAGELHTAAASVVDHLMEQGTFLSFVSTQPTGPALAEHFLDTTQSHHNYIHTQKYINLGYLPGESAGLLSFIIAPKKIIPLAFDGSNAWDSPPLISIDSIGDFKMILVITDDPNTAKIWIEQVGSRLNDTPLTMVVSAQVEPLIQPYFRTSPRQVSGYVAGIIDSMNYEKITERPFLANKIWLPFNMGIIISVGIIFIGGMANGVLSLFSRRKDEAIGESK